MCIVLNCSYSPALSDDESDFAEKPAKKKQAAMTDFFKPPKPQAPTQRKISKSMKPASPPKKKETAAAPRRPARAAVKQYVEIDSDSAGEGDDSMFVDDDD